MDTLQNFFTACAFKAGLGVRSFREAHKSAGKERGVAVRLGRGMSDNQISVYRLLSIKSGKIR